MRHQENRGINIDVGKKGDAKFGEVLASNNAKSFSGHLDASDKAQGSLTTVGQLLDIVASRFYIWSISVFYVTTKKFCFKFWSYR